MRYAQFENYALCCFDSKRFTDTVFCGCGVSPSTKSNFFVQRYHQDRGKDPIWQGIELPHFVDNYWISALR